MMSLPSLFLLLALGAVVTVLIVGLFAMARGKAGDAALSNRMMRWRIVLQGVLITALLVAFLAAR